MKATLVALVFVTALPCALLHAGGTKPYFKRRLPAPQKEADFPDSRLCCVDLKPVHVDPYPSNAGNLALYNDRFDARMATILRSAVAPLEKIRVEPHFAWIPSVDACRATLSPLMVPVRLDDEGHLVMVPVEIEEGHTIECPDQDLGAEALLELKFFGQSAPWVYHPTSKCLSFMAYRDYFPQTSLPLEQFVSDAILNPKTGAGWCGTFGPGWNNGIDMVTSKVHSEGNYDMTQMHLIHLAYRYYDELPDAREKLIKELLARGAIHRIGLDDTHTSGETPPDWNRAGLTFPHKNLGETENHILMITTARYLTNQLLYQRDQDPSHDNRRNGKEQRVESLVGPRVVSIRPHTTGLLLSLMRDILRDDFSEYNAKPYQEETRWALLDLCTYAYDPEVRLAARMVLDYVSARYAVSSDDLRRMVPFRRRNEDYNPKDNSKPRNAHDANGVMKVGLLEVNLGADPLAFYYALQAGNTRGYEQPNQKPLPHKPGVSDDTAARGNPWSIAGDGGADVVMEGLSDYRLPPTIHDLFVNDANRRFFQRLHRIPQESEQAHSRNCDNVEIYAGSPSYLISAGGRPCPYAVDPHLFGFVVGPQDDQKGVAVTTSFIPTGASPGFNANNAEELIQFGSFASDLDGAHHSNYCVAPDFACGYSLYLPPWTGHTAEDLPDKQFTFIEKKSPAADRPGFYLAIYKDGPFAIMEAFDTWRYSSLTFPEFKRGVLQRNPHPFRIENHNEEIYTTTNGNRIHYVISYEAAMGQKVGKMDVTKIDYAGEPGSPDTLRPPVGGSDAGNDRDPFLRGTILHSPSEAIVEVSNPWLKTKITLDMSDKDHPKRIDESGNVEYGDSEHEPWVDFDSKGPFEGDFYRPYDSLAAAIAAVPDGGTIRVTPGRKTERISARGKHVRIIAPIGGAIISAP